MSSSSSINKRLQKESAYAEQTLSSVLADDWKDSVYVSPWKGDLQEWKGLIRGPWDTVYEGGWFMVKIVVPIDYPLQPPKMWFETKVVHPNIHLESGEVCLDVLKSQWSPVWNIESALRAVQVMLGNPDAESPLNCDAGNLIRSGDVLGYQSVARMYVLDYASKDLRYLFG